MTAGGADGWPIFVGSYGLLGAMYPDQAALVEGLLTGEVALGRRAEHIELFNRYQIYATEMLEQGVTGLAHDATPARFAAGDVAFMPTGVWQAPTLEEAEPGFEWTYVPFPGSDNAADNQYLFGKYDQGWAIAANSPNQEAALAYLTAFSEPENYQAFVNAVGFIPTQPTATLDSQLGEAIAPYARQLPGRVRAVLGAADRRRSVGQRLAGGVLLRSRSTSGTIRQPSRQQAQSDLEAALGG